MPLRLRYFPREGTIRSVDAAPNGILTIGGDSEMGCTLAIHPTVTVPSEALERADADVLIKEIRGNAVAEGEATAIDTLEAIKGCVDRETVAMVWKTVVLACLVRTEQALENFSAEDIVEFGKLAVAVRDAIMERANDEGLLGDA